VELSSVDTCRGVYKEVYVVFPMVPGLGPKGTIDQCAVRVVIKHKPSVQLRFNGNLPARLKWAGCQLVAHRVSL
jgi:hypothetical protein